MVKSAILFCALLPAIFAGPPLTQVSVQHADTLQHDSITCNKMRPPHKEFYDNQNGLVVSRMVIKKRNLRHACRKTTCDPCSISQTHTHKHTYIHDIHAMRTHTPVSAARISRCAMRPRHKLYRHMHERAPSIEFQRAISVP